jgi:hypothetical protein
VYGSDEKPVAMGDLCALTTGSGAVGDNPNAIYFTAGLQNEQRLLGPTTIAAAMPEF